MGADLARDRSNIGVVNLPPGPDARQRAISKTTAGKRRTGPTGAPRRRLCHAALPILRRWRTVRLFTGLLFPCIDPPRSEAGAGSGWAVSPARRRCMETDMKDFGRRAGGEALQFGPGGLGSVFSELGAVVAAAVVLGFVILS